MSSRPSYTDLREVKCRLTEQDIHFLRETAGRLGIGRDEFLRRLIAEARPRSAPLCAIALTVEEGSLYIDFPDTFPDALQTTISRTIFEHAKELKALLGTGGANGSTPE